ncbi:MAG: FAD binding domain-containing protein [Bacteroidetes bacterium]|nr:FAD binding domain-containing protein [Bacteroidota bacterium]MBL0140435.1 FAD binding domain-containing protein [Bacteroidota bacterium]
MTGEKFYFKPETVAEAIQLAGENKHSFRFLAGGSDLLVNKFQSNAETDCLIDITEIAELKQVIHTGNKLITGTLIRLDDLKNYEIIRKNFPALLEAARAVASPLLRKTATLGGNILCENRCSFYNQSEWWREAVGYCLKCEGDVCIATGGKKACFSKFVSDTAPVLISMDAEIEVMDEHGIKTIPLESIYTGDGVNPRNLSVTSLIKNIILPTDIHFKTIFKKLRPREAVDFTSLTTAVTIHSTGKLKIVIGGVDPKPVVIEGTLNGNNDHYIKQALKSCRVVDNDHYSRPYRREMIQVFLTSSFSELIS